MKIEITLENDHALIEVDGVKVKATRKSLDRSGAAEKTIGNEVLTQLAEVIPALFILQDIQGVRGTWEELSFYDLQVNDEQLW